MFTFLNSSMLMGLLAVSIPLIIHLITRQKVKKIYFSSIVFLKELRTQKIRRIKIKHILLLIIRSLIILFLLLAFARPTLKGKLSSTLQAQAKTSIVVIFDNSLSMGREFDGQPVLEIAKEKSAALEELFKLGDEFYTLLAIRGSQPLYEGSRYDFNKVQQMISKTRASHHATDITSALLEAKQILLQSQNLNKEIYLISDLQKTGFLNSQELVSPILDNTNIKLYVIPIENNKISNLSIVKVTPANQIIEKGKVFELQVVVRNLGYYEVHNKLVQLYIEGKRSAQATVTLKPGDSQQISFKIIPDKTGLLAGSVVLEDDDQQMDNRWYFTFNVPDKINVLLLGKSSEDVRFLKLAAEISPNIEVDELVGNKIESNTIRKYDVVVLSNIPQLESSLGTELLNYTEQGGAVIIFLGSDVDLKNYNATLNEKLTLPVFSESIGDLNDQRSYLTFGKIDFDHPIFKGMFEKTPDEVESPKIYFTVRAKADVSTTEIIKLSNGIPFLCEKKYGKGKVHLFLTALDLQWSDFSIKGIFVPLMNRSLVYLAGSAEQEDRDLLIDQKISETIQAKSDYVNFKIEKPDGSYDKLRPQIRKGAYYIDYDQTDLMGIYDLYSNDEKVDRWAVNFHPEESDISMIEDQDLINIVGEDNITIIRKNSSIKDAILNTRYGKELWKYFIVVVLILMFTEMMIARDDIRGKQEIN